MKNKTFLKIITIIIPFGILLLFIFQNQLLKWTSMIPTCPVYSIFDLYCPGCGNTRSVFALLRGDVFTSLRYNIVPVILLVLLLSLYIELATYSFARYRRILPRQLSFYLILIGFFVIYLIVRNFIPYLTP